jgi:hypothetical protein
VGVVRPGKVALVVGENPLGKVADRSLPFILENWNRPSRARELVKR